MSMLSSSYTLLSSARAPLPLPLPAATVSFPRAPVSSWRQSSSRAPLLLLVCRSHKNTYGIHDNGSTISSGDWSIWEDNDHIYLKVKVKESTTKDDLDVQVTKDQELLVKYKDDSPTSKLDVCLLMPPGYDGNKVTAKILSPGWLQITLPKPKIDTYSIPVS